MSRYYREFSDLVKAWYFVHIEDNEIFLLLDSLEFKCDICISLQYIDLSLVPTATVPISCASCGKEIFVLEEADFEIQLIPADQVYDFLPFISPND